MSSYIVHRPDRPQPYLARFQPRGGRTVSKSFKTKRRAEQWLKTQEVDRSRGEWFDPKAGRLLFADQAAAWMSSRRANRANTNARDESVMRSLVLPYLGQRYLSDITIEAVEGWVSALVVQGKSPATIRKAHEIARGVFSSAVRARRIPRNPADDVSLPALPRVERRFLEAEEISALADAIDPRYRLLVLLGAYGGLRLGELAALKSSSFTTGLRAVKVETTLTDVRGVVRIGPPKTNAAIRTVALPRFLYAEVEHHLAAFPPHEDGFLFAGPLGGLMRFSAFRQRVWAPAVKAAGIAWCTPHALRHSQAALLIEAGEDPYVISKRLGHASIRTTYDVYGHLLPSADEAAAERLDAKSRTIRAPSPVVDIAKGRKLQ